jgi:hypothetical protein
MQNTVIQTLWIGERLTKMEQLSIASFLCHDHEVHLYVYERPSGVPKGTTLRDANTILPASAIFKYSSNGSYAGFANFFRYKLLSERGGWWVDTDLVCTRRFDFDDEYVFSSEVNRDVIVPNVGALKVPAQSPVMTYAWDFCQRADATLLRWGQTGPALIRAAIDAHGLQSCIKAPEVFCPIGWFEWQRLIEADPLHQLTTVTRGIHLWNELWRRSGTSKDADYPPSSLYETLKRRYLA